MNIKKERNKDRNKKCYSYVRVCVLLHREVMGTRIRIVYTTMDGRFIYMK